MNWVRSPSIVIKEGFDGDYAEYSYNYENRLIQAKNLSENQHIFGGNEPFPGTVEYTYDALGWKVEKEVDPAHGYSHGNMVEVTGFIYDGAGINILAEYEKEVRSSDGGHYRGNNYSNHFDRRDNINYYNEYYYGNGSLVAVNNISHPGIRWQRPEVSYYHQDVLGSVVMLTGRYGHVKERYEYDAYGNPYTGRFEQGNNMNPYGFTGQRYEKERRMVMKRSEVTVSKFFEGYNCAQAVFYSFCDYLKFDVDIALKIACGFGAGMGRKEEVCGAVSGGIMVIGAIYGRGNYQDTSLTEQTYRKTRELMDTFSENRERIFAVNCLGIVI